MNNVLSYWRYTALLASVAVRAVKKAQFTQGCGRLGPHFRPLRKLIHTDAARDWGTLPQAAGLFSVASCGNMALCA